MLLVIELYVTEFVEMWRLTMSVKSDILILPELVMFCAIFKPHGAEFLFKFCAVDIEVGAELVE